MQSRNPTSTVHSLPQLQAGGPGDDDDVQRLEPVLEDNPTSWDLISPPQECDEASVYTLEERAQLLLGAKHLLAMLEVPKLLLRFTGFLNSHRPDSIPILVYYFDTLKALRAIDYANSIADSLTANEDPGGPDSTSMRTQNAILEEKARRALDRLAQEELPAYVAYSWLRIVSASIQHRITGTLAPHLRQASEGLAEVFCLTDASRADNPIIFASEQFTRTTQYGMNYILGRNCRFLQGPQTSPHAVRRLANAVSAGEDHVELFLNYRRDGSLFMNLLMIAPLRDDQGNVKYFLGAQVDVSGLVKECSGMDGLKQLLEREKEAGAAGANHTSDYKDEFRTLSEMFNPVELGIAQKYGGRMHQEHVDNSHWYNNDDRSRLLLRDRQPQVLRHGEISPTVDPRSKHRLGGIYQHVCHAN